MGPLSMRTYELNLSAHKRGPSVAAMTDESCEFLHFHISNLHLNSKKGKWRGDVEPRQRDTVAA